MAQFHVGQRVRVVAVEQDSGPRSRAALGKVGAVMRLGVISSTLVEMEYLVQLDGDSTKYCFDSCHLAPLTDPPADRFIESIKKLGREPINDAPKVTVTK